MEIQEWGEQDTRGLEAVLRNVIAVLRATGNNVRASRGNRKGKGLAVLLMPGFQSELLLA